MIYILIIIDYILLHVYLSVIVCLYVAYVPRLSVCIVVAVGVCCLYERCGLCVSVVHVTGY